MLLMGCVFAQVDPVGRLAEQQGLGCRYTWTLQGVSNGLPHTYRLPLGTPWRVLVYDI